MSLQLLCTNYGNIYDAIKVVDHCKSIMKFDRVTILHPEPVVSSINVQKAYSKNQNECLVKEVPNFITCDHCISIHWDGFIVQPYLWEEKWLEYDWIGCPWSLTNLPNPKWRVGSGGFMMFSRQMAKAWGSICNIEENFDWQVGALYRDQFEALGLTYAPLEEAAKFGKECDLEDFPIEEGESFGFHGFGENPGFAISEKAKEHRKQYRTKIYGMQSLQIKEEEVN